VAGVKKLTSCGGAENQKGREEKLLENRIHSEFTKRNLLTGETLRREVNKGLWKDKKKKPRCPKNKKQVFYEIARKNI